MKNCDSEKCQTIAEVLNIPVTEIAEGAEAKLVKTILKKKKKAESYVNL